MRKCRKMISVIMLMVMLVSLLPSGALAAEAPTGATNEVASVEEPTEVEPATGETEETLPVESKTDGTENEDNNSNTEGTSEGAPVSDDNEKDPAEDGTIGTAKSEETVSAPDALKAPEPVVLNKGAADEIVVSVEDAAPGSSLSASIAIPSDYDEQIKLVAGEDYELLLALDIHLDPIGDWVQVKLQSPLLAYAADERGEQPALYHVYEENGVKRAIQIDFEADWIKGEITFTMRPMNRRCGQAASATRTTATSTTAGTSSGMLRKTEQTTRTTRTERFCSIRMTVLP